ncbi:MAG: TolC family protein [Planctomycetaceae bacterium]
MRAAICGAMLCASFVGCHHAPSVAKLAYISQGNKPLQYYEDVATEIAYPVESCKRDPVDGLSEPPRLIYDILEDDEKDLTLAEAIQTALENGAVIRDNNSFGSPANPVLANPNGARSVYDIGIIESGILFGNRGVEAALADFDAQTTTTMTWGRTEQIQNSANLGINPGQALQQDSAAFSTQIQKQLANSGIFTLQHDMNYSYSDVDRTFPSAFDGFARATYRQPLLAGSGTEFTRIAGPIGSNLTGVSGVAQGVVISRINTDIALADLENALATMVRDVETVYWDLQLAYQVFEAERAGANYYLAYLKRLGDRIDAGPEQIAQAKASYQESVGRMKGSLADINTNELLLRRMMGLKRRDGRVLRPTDEPTQADFAPDWRVTVAEGLTRRPEIRAQKWNIKSLQLQLKAAKNLTRPRLDAVAQYQVNAFGDQLFGSGDSAGTGFINDSAYESLLNNTTSSWNLGFQLAFPIGFRTAHTQVRNYEFRLRKARTMLAAQESEVAYELDNSYKSIERWKVLFATNREILAAHRKTLVEALNTLEKSSSDQAQGPNILNRLVQAHVNVRQAQINYSRSLIEYNKALVDLNFRKGAILAENNIHLSESQWCPGAYDDALRRAWSRTYARDTTLKSSLPIESAESSPRNIALTPVPAPQPLDDPFTVPANSRPKPAEDDRESDYLRSPDSPNLEEPTEPDTYGETVQRTGYAIPVRPVMPIPAQPNATRFQKPQNVGGAQKAVPAARRVDTSDELNFVEPKVRRTGASKAR